MSKATLSSLPYHEPDITTILVQSSLLILLNVVSFFLNKFLYCGLIGQILLGIAWGTPGLKWLEPSVETTMVQLGYIGLLLLVYEGGLSTSLESLRASIWVSMTVAMTGISIPIGLSFVLMRLTGATPLQCFAAGASLSSTSLGTTFTVLATSGLTKSRLGVVLTTAAMIDDVVGLVLVQVISNLGKEGASFTASIVVRPLTVSIGFMVLTPLTCVFVVKPLTRQINQVRKRLGPGVCNHLMASERTSLFAHMLILLGYVTGASYAGTSNLFAAYIAGASVTWWDTRLGNLINDDEPSVASSSADEIPVNPSVNDDNQNSSDMASGPHTSVESPAASGMRASIGFSIPVTKMFSGDIVWKGFVYAILMILAKLACGIWLVRISETLPVSWKSAVKKTKQVLRLTITPSTGFLRADKIPSPEDHRPAVSPTESATHPGPQTSVSHNRPGHNSPRTRRSAKTQAGFGRKKGNDNSTANDDSDHDRHDHAVSPTHTPRSLYPASIIGFAMVARGEVGFLISPIAESNNVFSTSSKTNSTSDLFLVVTWAIVLCTIMGPMTVGLLVRRVRELQRNAKTEGQIIHRDVLGSWGIP
ncbi:hypothetical protein E4U21_005178 [Claviceps maximensis]|nr:hypothetical protein E4U21_005178 [Claviceps maximensis]